MNYHFKKAHLEAFFWIASILALALTQPDNGTHFSLCLIKNMGFDFCPGCGLGHSISYLFNGQLRASFEAHPLGLIAIIILLHRAYTLLKHDININFNNQKHE